MGGDSLNQLITSEVGKPVVYPAAVSDYPAVAKRAFIGYHLTETSMRQAVNFITDWRFSIRLGIVGHTAVYGVCLTLTDKSRHQCRR